eukprot:CAMPEP_0173393890 /NCGR_PEP_ID=MMETSP1356-20130122/22377_1 /TAXON_ID=77927 ORGANISM="Hemiselmis virescens, Strain PCC157" /NCGR_SAMPLE_ID=MMETSP1356 /ASSEMBLY_ACC=CAM_ASM_000847 /LENGTH=96 /DNA_ID=CAMNT_0014351979 /DNA_START=38 /DNA_END=328 /DNA_ORIENTATION=+
MLRAVVTSASVRRCCSASRMLATLEGSKASLPIRSGSVAAHPGVSYDDIVPALRRPADAPSSPSDSACTAVRAAGPPVGLGITVGFRVGLQEAAGP